MKLLLPLAFVTVSAIVWLHNAHAQLPNDGDFSGKLIYRRRTTTEELVGVTPFTQHRFNVPIDSCTVVSTRGTFIATSTDASSDIIVQRFSTGDTVGQFAWQSTWVPCFFFWLDDTTLRVGIDGIQEFVDLNVKTGDTSQFVVPPHTPRDYPQLPSRFEDQPVLPSPNGNLLLYERCLVTNSIVTEYGEVLCAGERDWAIYNTSTQQNVTTIIAPGHIYSDVAPYDSAAYAIWAGVKWSPDSRFLAYVRPYTNTQFPLQIVDTATGQMIDFSFVNVKMDVQRGFFWSPDSRKLAFWVGADLNNIEGGSRNSTFVIFNTLTSTFTQADQARLTLDIRQNGLWAPDGSGFVYLDINRNLVHVDADTGVMSTVDTNVLNIELWTSLTLPVANAGPDQTTTDSDGNGFELITLDGSGSSDPDGIIVSYDWSEDGVSITNGLNPQIRLGVGEHTITLTVTDDDGASHTDDVVIIIEPQPSTTHDAPIVAEGKIFHICCTSNNNDLSCT